VILRSTTLESHVINEQRPSKYFTYPSKFYVSHYEWKWQVQEKQPDIIKLMWLNPFYYINQMMNLDRDHQCQHDHTSELVMIEQGLL